MTCEIQGHVPLEGLSILSFSEEITEVLSHKTIRYCEQNLTLWIPALFSKLLLNPLILMPLAELHDILSFA